ncbi:BrnT family toxin [Lamprobacter modestohalophilus]|uniref:BrnT family toxin n=1 Tax=Lamprobacter modestohalophilus TaxID=1064514 RepID=UPI002ADEBDED|nr:BrnT family toxin [Lamprobacter modestohalophilus]MEA1050501.1 BrnT family toxin [Lamprobacter modestohalophilus]
MITWDDAKRRSNLAKHGLDFAEAEAVLDGPMTTEEDARVAYGEQRINALGLLHSAVIAMTYTERNGDLHIISLRKATRYEAQAFARGIFGQP